MESLVSIIILVLILIVLFITGFMFLQLRRKEDDKSMILVHQDINNLREQLRNSLDSTSQLVNQQLGQVGSRLDSAVSVVGEVQKGLGRLEESSKRIYEISKDISGFQHNLGLIEQFSSDFLDKSRQY